MLLKLSHWRNQIKKNNMIALLLTLFLQLALFGICILFIIWAWSVLFIRVPFVPIPYRVIKPALAALNLHDGDIFYDIGAGEGRLLIASAKQSPKVIHRGIEIQTFPYILSRIFQILFARKSKNLTFIKGDFFDQDVSDATHIFTYLLPSLMNKIYPKLKESLKPGTILVSCDFEFKDKKPVKTIILSQKHWRCKRLHVYSF